MKTERKELDCSELKQLLGDFDCCSSCHEDWDEGWDFALDVDFTHEGQNYRAWTCCAGLRAVEERDDGKIQAPGGEDPGSLPG